MTPGPSLDPVPDRLVRLRRIDESGRIPLPPVMAACDANHVLLGRNGASAVYAPQKGANAADVRFLEAAMERLVEVAGGEDLARLRVPVRRVVWGSG